ncbi:cellulose biosynthesis protein BcsP [Undibacterium sp. Dicai25W]|uniref:cellulose biosynthesis protein BcsP n=1 Tax=Undibacterium sp. Dicai25W TaxID=3413034 RepID=UPI003BF16A9F
MNDDVKNLFQKFGQTTNSYQEINRDIDSEQAKQRWPLLRDVRVNEAPQDLSHEFEEAGVAIMAPPDANAESLLSQVAMPKVNGAALNSTPPVAPSTNDFFEIKQSLFATKVVTPPVENKVNSLFSSRPVGSASTTASTSAPANAIPFSSKSHSVSEVFKRLLNQDQQPQKVEAPVNSFFKKIFRP